MKSLLSKGIDVGNKKDLEDKLMGAAEVQSQQCIGYYVLPPDSNFQTKIQWEHDMGIPITTTQWEATLKNSTPLVNSNSKNSSFIQDGDEFNMAMLAEREFLKARLKNYF